MSFHKGNAFLTNVTADNLRTTWTSWTPRVDDENATLVADSLTHARYFSTRNFAVASVYITVLLDGTTPAPYTSIAVLLPPTLRVRSGTTFRNQCMVERFTGSAERKFSLGMLLTDGETRGGAAGEEYVNTDRIIVENLGQFVAGQTYTIRGQIVFQPAAAA